MTTIVGKIEKNKIILASDSRITRGYARVDKNYNCSKLFSVNNLIIGVTGHVSEFQLFEAFLEDHGVGDNLTPVKLCKFMLEFKNWAKEQAELDVTHNNNYIIGHSSGLYHVMGFTAYKCLDFCADGSGGDYALMAMHLGKSPQEAVELACEVDCFSDLPVSSLEIELKEN